VPVSLDGATHRLMLPLEGVAADVTPARPTRCRSPTGPRSTSRPAPEWSLPAWRQARWSRHGHDQSGRRRPATHDLGQHPVPRAIDRRRRIRRSNAVASRTVCACPALRPTRRQSSGRAVSADTTGLTTQAAGARDRRAGRAPSASRSSRTGPSVGGSSVATAGRARWAGLSRRRRRAAARPSPRRWPDRSDRRRSRRTRSPGEDRWRSRRSHRRPGRWPVPG